MLGEFSDGPTFAIDDDTFDIRHCDSLPPYGTTGSALTFWYCIMIHSLLLLLLHCYSISILASIMAQLAVSNVSGMYGLMAIHVISIIYNSKQYVACSLCNI